MKLILILFEFFTTQELKFETLKFNAVAAQMSRGKSEKTLAFAMSVAMGWLRMM